MSEKFPKCKSVGLDVRECTKSGCEPLIYAHDVEKILSEGVEVFGHNGVSLVGDYRASVWAPDPDKFNYCDHYKGLIINVHPIKHDSAERVLKDLIAEWNAGKIYAPADNNSLYERAKRLTGGG